MAAGRASHLRRPVVRFALAVLAPCIERVVQKVVLLQEGVEAAELALGRDCARGWPITPIVLRVRPILSADLPNPAAESADLRTVKWLPNPPTVGYLA